MNFIVKLYWFDLISSNQFYSPYEIKNNYKYNYILDT